MPAGYSSRCKLCNSRHRAEVEQWVRDKGVSYREAARRLADLGETISYVAISRHCREHFDVQAEAREQYQKSQEQMNQAVAKHLSEVEMLKKIAQTNYELHLAAATWLTEMVKNKEVPPRALVGLLSATAAELRQHVKARQELLGEDAESRKADALQSWADLMMVVDDD